jgi:mannose-6-phosphate isomerase-like protein (cupin superfamily)
MPVSKSPAKNEIITPELLNECTGVDYRVQELVLTADGRTSYVRHKKRYIFLSGLSGEAVLIGDGLVTELKLGRSVSIPRKTKYMLINEGEEDFRFLFTEYGSIAKAADIELCDETQIPKRYRIGSK